MAQIFEQAITIKLSVLIKTDSEPKTLVTEELIASLEAVAQELAGDRVVVEVESN